MSTVTVRPFALIPKDTNESRIIVFDWNEENLATSVTITTSTWTITRLEPSAALDTTTLTKDNESILSGSRKTHVRIIAGTLGGRYRLTNKVTTNETPAQIKEKSVDISVVEQ
jgi:hypothetical protein